MWVGGESDRDSWGRKWTDQKMFGTNRLDHNSVEGGAEGKEGTWLDSQVYSSGIGSVLLPRLRASAPQTDRITENT